MPIYEDRFGNVSVLFGEGDLVISGKPHAEHRDSTH
jgi:hypothetical protein